MNRRTFIRSSSLAAAGSLLGAPSCATHGGFVGNARTDHPVPCPPEAWEKHGVVLEPTEPWEDTSIQNFTCAADPIEGGAWRLWYSVSGRRERFRLAYAEGVPGGRMKKVPAQCSAGEPVEASFAIGNLPDAWKPTQGVNIRLLNGRQRLYFWAHGPRVLRYLAAESEDGRRYRVLNPLRPVLYHPSDRAAYGVASPDGLKVYPQPSRERLPGEPLAPSLLISNDATNIYQLPDGSFEMYSVGLVQVPIGDPGYVAQDNAPGLLRVIDRYTSADGLDFETRQRVIERDAQDPADQQFYYLAVTSTTQGRVGMLGHYRCRAQTMDLEWCFSGDGVAWQRPLRRAWVPRGTPPAPDCYGLYGNSHLVQHAGRWHLFYTGVNESHNGRRSYGKARQVVMYATVKSIWG